jgi:tetratricopeptide (TPR) repeat protein
LSLERNEPQATLAAALDALRNGDLAGATTISRRLLDATPRDPAVLQLAAAIDLQQGDAAAAARWAAASLALRPDHAPTLLIAGRAARASGRLTQALDVVRRAVLLAPAKAEAAFLLCILLLESGDGAAQTVLARLLEQFPDDAAGWRELGIFLQQAKQWEAALIAFTRAARAAPSAAAHVRCARLLQSLGRLDEATEAYERSLMLDPAAGEVWFALGLVRQDKRDLASAIAAYRKALETRPELAEAAVNLGICHQQAGDMTAAKEAYRRALRLRPDTFGRIAQALVTAPTGELWLDLGALRRSLGG